MKQDRTEVEMKTEINLVCCWMRPLHVVLRQQSFGVSNGTERSHRLPAGLQVEVMKNQLNACVSEKMRTQNEHEAGVEKKSEEKMQK